MSFYVNAIWFANSIVAFPSDLTCVILRVESLLTTLNFDPDL